MALVFSNNKLRKLLIGIITMALVIQSNQAATNNIGNYFGVKSTNDYALVLDFEREVYKKRGADGRLTDINIADFLDFERASTAHLINQYGEIVEYAQNVPRIGELYGKKGLILEGYRRNYFLNPSTPVTQSISLPSSNELFAVEVYGSGSLSVSAANITILSSNTTATEGKPVVFKQNTPSTTSVTATASGELKHAQIEMLVDKYQVFGSPIATGRVDRYNEIASINNALIAELIGSGKEITVVAHVKREAVDKSYYETSKNSSMFSVEYTDNKQYGSVINAKDGEVKINEMTASSEATIARTSLVNVKSITSAISLTEGAISVGANGYSTYKLDGRLSDKTIKTVSLYSSVAKPHHVLQKLVIYPRALTSEEVAVVSGSWV